MAGTYTATGTISNLTRVELEQLRRADFYSNSKALTIGDSGLLPEGVVGKGDVNAEPYFTGPNLKLDDVYSADLPTQPGPGLTTLTAVGGMVSETTRWYGPTYIHDGVGFAVDATTWQDNTPALNYTLFVNVGDILLVKTKDAGGDLNRNAVGTITARTANTLTLSAINNPDIGGSTLNFGNSTPFQYIIVRANAVQLFAVPGSGPSGQEQTFLTVLPNSTLHSNLAPSIDDINADRITNLVPPSYALDSSVDRADSVYGSPAPRTSLEQLGYRVILYRDDGTGLAPNLSAPLPALNPVIDSTIPASDQRMTVDFKAGVVRFSCAPRLGDDIKVAGGINPTSGRLSLYAVFWAVDTSLTKGSARSLYAARSNDTEAFPPAKVFFNNIARSWEVGSTADGNQLYIQAVSNAEFPGTVTRFGILDPTNTPVSAFKYFSYRRTINASDPQVGYGWRIQEQNTTVVADGPPFDEVRFSDKQSWSLGDGTAPHQLAGADFNPEATVSPYGYRLVQGTLTAFQAVVRAAESGYGTLHIRRGEHILTGTVTVPPGLEIRGEGSGTVFKSVPSGGGGASVPLFKFGPNTPYGTYTFDISILSGAFVPHKFSWAGSLEGFDIVWNAARRVWGIVQADPVSNGIWFNEVTPAGQALYPGVGINIKPNSNNLFTADASLGQTHTGGHYPRIAHHTFTDEYSVVWVEDVFDPGPPAFVPRVAYQGIKWNVPTATQVTKFDPVIYPSGHLCRTHPSIAVDNGASVGYAALITFWTYNSDLSLTSLAARTINADTGATLVSGDTVLLAKQMASSTDVTDDGSGNFLVAYSVLDHPIYYSATGESILSNNTITDATPPLGDLVVAGVANGSRFVQLWKSGNNDSGRSGVIRALTATSFALQYDDFNPNASKSTDTGITYALVPATEIRTLFFNGTSFDATQRIAGALGLATTTYRLTEREPDFVRVSHGSGQYLVAYQVFDSNGYLSQNTLQDFYRNSINSRCMTVQRQHLATCYAILNYQGVLIGPSATPPDTGWSSSTEFLYESNATPVTMRSLSGRVLNIPYPNLMSGTLLDVGSSNTSRLEMEVSARNYCLPWALTQYTSLIPDVTWSGTDWVVVSPCVKRIASDTGTYVLSGDPFLDDPSVYFGSGTVVGSAPEASFLHKTITGGGVDKVYFPSTGETIPIHSVISEHRIRLNSAPTIVSGTSQVAWTLIKGAASTFGTAGGLKNPGYRVSPNGEVVVGGEFFTFADPPADGDLASPRVTELLDRQLWGDATFTGDVGTNQFADPLPKFGAKFCAWNDAIGTSRVAADVTFRGVTVGAPKPTTWEFPKEAPMVAIAWGPNFYGCLERVIFTGDHHSAFFRQSFGPWNSGLKDLALEAGSPVRSGTSRGLQVTSKEHVFTRHGYTVGGNPYFATDGYRNTFAFIGVPYLSASYPFYGNASLGNLLEEKAYAKSINTIHTDAVGRDPIFHRGPSFVGESPRDMKDGLDTGSVDIEGLSTERLHAAAPKVVWTGKKYVSFFPTILEASIPPGASQQTGQFAGVMAGPTAQYWPKFRGIVNMVAHGGDEHSGVMNEALIGNVEHLLGPFTAGASYNSGKVVANTTITCGAMLDSEIREVVVLDVAYSGKVFCVVWSMGYNISGSPASSYMGGSVIGYSIFPDLEGNDTLGSSSNPVNVPAHVIETDSAGMQHLTKARFLNPRVVWDGKKFLIVFQYMDDNDGALESGKYLRAVTVSEDGPGNQSVVKALSANTSNNSGNQIKGIRRANSHLFLGVIALNAGSQNGIIVRSTTVDAPWSDVQVMPGDVIEITGITPLLGSGEANTSYNGFWPVLDYVRVGTTMSIVDIGQNFDDLFGPVNPLDIWYVHGAVHSGGLSTSPSQASDGSYASGVNSKSYLLTSESTAASKLTLGAYVSKLYGLAHNEDRGEYAVLALCGIFGGTVTSRLRLLIVKQSTMSIIKEVDITSDSGSGTIVLPAALGWNGSHYLAVYSTGYGLAEADMAFALISATGVVEQTGTFAVFQDNITGASSTGNKTMPGAGYGLFDGTLSLRPVLDSCHVVWNHKLSKWAVSVSYVTRGGSAHDSYTAAYNEKPLAWRETQDISSWTGDTITWAAGNGRSYPGLRLVFTREEVLSSGLTPSNYRHSGETSTLDANISAAATTFDVAAANFNEAGNFYAVIGSLGSQEIVFVGAVSGVTFSNVIRGAGGTIAQVHAAGDTVTSLLDYDSVNSVVDYLDVSQFAPGDALTIPAELQKPRRISRVVNNQLTVEGSLFARGSLTSADTYTVTTFGRTALGASADSTYTATTVRSTTPVNFITAFVRPGMEVLIADNNTATGVFRARVLRIFTGVATNDSLEFHPAISPVPADGTRFWVRKQANLITNIKTRPGSNSVEVDVLDTDRKDPAFFSNTLDRGYYLVREDVFLYTLGFTAPAVSVENADGVYLENVDIGGYQDIQERMYHMARPLRRSGGSVYGDPQGAVVNSRSPTDHLLMTPEGKVSTLRLTNVRSKTKIKYGSHA